MQVMVSLVRLFALVLATCVLISALAGVTFSALVMVLRG
jgi:hypothetical protein